MAVISIFETNKIEGLVLNSKPFVTADQSKPITPTDQSTPPPKHSLDFQSTTSKISLAITEPKIKSKFSKKEWILQVMVLCC